MKRLNVLVLRFCGLIASLALIVGVSTTSTICFLMFHQPKVPEGMSKFRK
ncbi:MAG: cyclic lactone autoinducer peptide [Oscillospiraceae bacterium]|nr:cyclic lactone autoinducer peptide [Oscillospiraceae bacterium]